MILNAIFWTDPYGQTELIAITDDEKRWLEVNNKLRVGDGEDPESITDFTIEEVYVDIFHTENGHVSGFGTLEGKDLSNSKVKLPYVEEDFEEEWTTSVVIKDKYESVKADNEDYFVQEKEE